MGVKKPGMPVRAARGNGRRDISRESVRAKFAQMGVVRWAWSDWRGQVGTGQDWASGESTRQWVWLRARRSQASIAPARDNPVSRAR